MGNTPLPWDRSIEYESDLTPDEMMLRDAVVTEYLFDHSWVNACKRLGMNSNMAQEYAQRFESDSYVQKRLKDFELREAAKPEANKKAEFDQKKQRIIQQLEAQAVYNGPGASHAARVAALKQLSVIYGFEAPKQTKVDVGVSSGVMLVPMIGGTDSWEQSAKAAQNKLQEDTMNGLDIDPTVH